MKKFLILGLLFASLSVHSETPAQLLSQYSAEARVAEAGFVASAKRGDTLFHQQFGNNADMPGCASCHTNSPLNIGKHTITGKRIKPLAVAANTDRFSDSAKVEKWFGRNCKEVIGRACAAGEKADFIAYMSEVR